MMEAKAKTEFELLEEVRKKIDELFRTYDNFKKELIDECGELIQRRIKSFDEMLTEQQKQQSCEIKNWIPFKLCPSCVLEINP